MWGPGLVEVGQAQQDTLVLTCIPCGLKSPQRKPSSEFKDCSLADKKRSLFSICENGQFLGQVSKKYYCSRVHKHPHLTPSTQRVFNLALQFFQPYSTKEKPTSEFKDCRPSSRVLSQLKMCWSQQPATTFLGQGVGTLQQQLLRLLRLLLLLPLLFLPLLKCVNGNAVTRSDDEANINNTGALSLPPFLKFVKPHETDSSRGAYHHPHPQYQQQQTHVRASSPFFLSPPSCQKLSFYIITTNNNNKHNVTKVLQLTITPNQQKMPSPGSPASPQSGGASSSKYELWMNRNEGRGGGRGGEGRELIDNFMHLENLNASQGFVATGIDAFLEAFGYSLSACDFNQDGLSDIIIGTTRRVHMIYGRANGYATLNLANMTEEEEEDQGFIISFTASSSSGGPVREVRCVGDINQDGFPDTVASIDQGAGIGALLVVYGKPEGSSSFHIANLTSDQGFIINGITWSNYLPWIPFSGAGDFNDDGIQDLVVGSPSSSNGEEMPEAGRTYVIYGKSGLRSSFSLSDGLTPDQGFIIDGEGSNHRSGYSVGGAGDFNQDGISDIIIGVPYFTSGRGRAYVIYGKQGGYSSLFLKNLTSDQASMIHGGETIYGAGKSVGAAGDLNNDSIPDVIVAGVDVNEEAFIFVVYGKSGGYSSVNLTSVLDLENLDQGFLIGNVALGAVYFLSMSSGDCNNDGISDVLLGSAYADDYRGRVYLIYGKQGGYSAIDTTTMTSDEGFLFYGPASTNYVGYALSPAGDFNNDGKTDFMIGAPLASRPSGQQFSGQVYFIYGGGDGHQAPPPSPSPPTNSPTASPSISISPSRSFSPSGSPTPSVSFSASESPSSSISISPSISLSISVLPTPSVSLSASVSPTASTSKSVSASHTPSKIPSPSSSISSSGSTSISLSSSSTPSPSPTPFRDETGGSVCPFTVLNGIDMTCSSELGKPALYGGFVFLNRLTELVVTL